MIQLEICIELNWQYGSFGAKHLFILHTFFILLKSCIYFELAFPTGRDSPTFWDKGTEVPGQRNKGTRSKSCQGTGRAGTACQNSGVRCYLWMSQANSNWSEPGLNARNLSHCNFYNPLGLFKKIHRALKIWMRLYEVF